MSLLVADAASALKDARLRTLGFVVAFLTTVEAATTATLTGLRALASKMTRLTAAVGCREQMSKYLSRC